MIVSFRDKKTRAFYNSEFVKAFSGFERAADKALAQLDAATVIGDLARPANNLEALKGDRKGQWSIRVNKQWRACFTWPADSNGPQDVEIVDYH